MFLATQAQVLDENAYENAHGDVQASVDRQSRAVFQSLARDMPLRMASAEPSYLPNLSSAAIRLRRFVAFYPAFANAALFSLTGRMLANTQLRPCAVEAPARDMFDGGLKAGYCGVAYDEVLARTIGGHGSDALIYTGVACPHDRRTAGVLIARLH